MHIHLIAMVTFIFFGTTHSFNTNETDLSDVEGSKRSEILSRRKRFLIFPEGSSVQLVFCNTFPTITTIGDIFLWGYTAALAYELPQDPYSPFRHKADPLHRRIDSKMIYFTDENGRVLHKQEYHRKPIVNPAFAKRSVDGQFKKGTSKFKIDRKQMHTAEHKREFFKREHMDEHGVEFHRSSRASLYRKIETLLRGMSGNGRQCLLKTLCIVGQTGHKLPQGGFLGEILKAVFTLPKGQFEDEEHREYDKAHFAMEFCDKLYPECELGSVTDVPTFNY